MFEGLSEKLSGIFDSLTRRGSLSEEDVGVAMREVRRALLEADVALDVVRSFVDKARARAVGAEVLKSVTPGQMVVKIVNDVLIETLGSNAEPIDLNAAPPVAIMMVGLQGAGKTTTSAKIAKRLTERFKKRVLMASLDVKRPAAQEQLAVLGRQVGVDTLPIVPGQTPVQIARRAEEAARLQGYDVVLFDTAGRTHIDEPLMVEMAEIKAAAKPHEILLVADALTGQDAVNLAKNFDDRVGITGIVLTRVDGDGRGGAALSMRAVTGKPIKLIGTGEKMDALDDFHPQRIANRILGMGDIVALVEKAAETIDADKAMRIADKMRKGKFDLQDMADQLAQVETMGGLGGIMGLLPGMGKIKDAHGQRQYRRQHDQAPARDHPVDDDRGAPQPRHSQGLAQAAHRRRLGHQGRRAQPPAQAASHHRRHDEVDAGRQARADGANGADVRPRRRHAPAFAGGNRRVAEEIRRRRGDGRGDSAKPARRPRAQAGAAGTSGSRRRQAGRPAWSRRPSGAAVREEEMSLAAPSPRRAFATAGKGAGGLN